MKTYKPSGWAAKGFVSLAILVALPLLISPAYAQVKGIATLKDFTGEVLIKNNGKWGTAYVKDVTLYTGDKVVSRQGTAYVVFHDGSELNIEPNSNIKIIERDVKKGFIFKKTVKERRIRVLLGKTRYKEEFSKKRETRFEAPTAVAALRGTDISFGVDPEGNAYGVVIDGTWFTVGEVLAGEAPDLPREIADRTPAQRAALVATVAAKAAAEAAGAAVDAMKEAVTDEDKVKAEQQKAQAALAAAEAASQTAKESKNEADALVDNADDAVAKEAKVASDAAVTALEAAAASIEAAKNAVTVTTDLINVVVSAIDQDSQTTVDAAIKQATKVADLAKKESELVEALKDVVDGKTIGEDVTEQEREVDELKREVDELEKEVDEGQGDLTTVIEDEDVTVTTTVPTTTAATTTAATTTEVTTTEVTTTEVTTTEVPVAETETTETETTETETTETTETTTTTEASPSAELGNYVSFVTR
ncbi:MAG: hypothetical protein KAV83_03330 [Desulfobacterales bacterium]|nr:hypothetical protein [Desulfobacterales bacterium]